MMFTGLLPAWGQSPGGFSEVHFDGTFLILGQHILDTSDIGVLLQETNEHFQNLSKSNGKDLSWDCLCSKPDKQTVQTGDDSQHYYRFLECRLTHFLIVVEVAKFSPLSEKEWHVCYFCSICIALQNDCCL